MNDKRLDRMESKIDRVENVLTKLVEHEVILSSVVKRLDSHSVRMDETDDDLVVVKMDVQKNSSSSRFGERVFFLVLTAAVGAVAYSLRG